MEITCTPIDPKELAIFENLKYVKVVFDVGARVDVEYIKIKPDIELHLFEPDPKFVEELERRAGKMKNVHINGYGLGDKEGMIRYHFGRQAFEAGECPLPGGGEKKFPVKTLNWYIEENNIKRIDFLKIDTEGYDYKVLLGGSKAIEMAKYIQYEHWDDQKQFHDLLEPKFGFKYLGNRNVLCTRL